MTTTTTSKTTTTAQRLAALIKSARQTMRKDKGLSTDLDRLPLLTWLMFLKFLDDLEELEASRAKMAGNKFRATIDAPYRWRDWAAVEDGITGPELLAFVNQEEAIGPDGVRRPGLLTYLRGLFDTNGHMPRRRVIAAVFKDVTNRMISGYLLREVISKVNGIHFLAEDELFTLGHIYESMLKEMRDAAGENGEFYTPRPVVRFMVEVTDPRLGETVLDPAAGTGGFLVEAFRHLERQVATVQDRRRLHHDTLFGGEAKPLPYLLCQMNLLLHGVEAPNISPGNSLGMKIAEMSDRERVDIVLTNPPFGGEEERGILSNFPHDRQTSETALLFLQVIMRRLRRGSSPGRAAVVLPDGLLSQAGVAARVRADLVDRMNLHTVVRLPRGVFEPYTRSSTSLLFFDARTPQEGLWFYELKVRDGIKAYTQNRPFLYEELTPCLDWWGSRVENEAAWLVSREAIREADYALNVPNPRTLRETRYSAPDVLLRNTQTACESVLGGIHKLTSRWQRLTGELREWPCKPFGELAEQTWREVLLEDDVEYPVLATSWYAKGLYIKHRKLGREIKAAKLYEIKEADFVYNRLFAWKGSFAEAGPDVDGCVASNEFPVFIVDRSQVEPGFLWAYFAQPAIWEYIEGLSTGTSSTSRLRLKEHVLQRFTVPIPPKPVQRELAAMWAQSLPLVRGIATLSAALGGVFPAVFERAIPPRKGAGSARKLGGSTK